MSASTGTPSPTVRKKLSFNNLFLYILTNHRSFIVVVFGLPFSFLWDTVLKVRSFYIRTFKSAPHLHDQRVRAVIEQVIARPDPNAPICTARPGWQSVSLSYRTYKKKWNAIEMPLYDILELDKSNMIIRVEPFVSIGQLTHALNPQGLTLPVVPEMDDLTVGGLINGTGIESSSHKYGLFHEIVTELELLLGDGSVVVATPDNEYSDLFRAIPWSYGTIALLLSAKLKLIPCKNFVKLTYLPFHSKEEYIKSLRSLSGEDEIDMRSKNIPMFLEGLAYSQNDAVVMKGEFVSKDEVESSKTNRLGLWYKPWFYKHVQSKLKSNEQTVEYIPLRDYYHRHTPSMFWEMELMIPIGNHVLFRYLLGWLLPPKVSFLKISQTEMTRQLVEKTHVAQDFLVPTRKMSEFLDSCHEHFDQLYPLWLCLHDHSPMNGSILKDPLCPNKMKDGHEMYIDIGVYGLPKCVHEKREDEFDMKKSMKAITAELRTMNGFQMLYADVFDNKKEFEEMYDHSQYREIRKKYKADTGIFREVYDKMSVIS